MTKQGEGVMSEKAPSVLPGLAYLSLMARFYNFVAPSQPLANRYWLSGEYLGRSKPLIAVCGLALKDKTKLLLLFPLAARATSKHCTELIAIRLGQARASYTYYHIGRAAVFAPRSKIRHGLENDVE